MDDNYKIAIAAAIEAGRVIKAVYSEDFENYVKEDASPVTEADTKANAVITAYLSRTGIPVISEENIQISYGVRKEWKSCWIVDPLDGTKEFIKKNGEFTVNIALVANGEPLFGVIYIPVKNTLYYADVASGQAFRAQSEIEDINAFLANSSEIRPSAKAGILRVAGSRSHMNAETEDYITALAQETGKIIEEITVGSSLKFCMIAEGSADVYPRFAPTMEWDTAAGHAICKAVGVSVINPADKKEIRYNKENLLNSHFLVFAGKQTD